MASVANGLVCLNIRTLHFALFSYSVFKFYMSGYIGYYIVMATFSWLSIINYNLWKTFNNIGVGRKSRFLRYNIVVWSGAAGLVLVAFLIDLLNPFLGIPMDLTPGIGLYECWMNSKNIIIFLHSLLCCSEYIS